VNFYSTKKSNYGTIFSLEAGVGAMNMMVLSQLEENIYELSLDEQLWLIERLAQHIRTVMVEKDNIETQLIAMANDPEIQDELQMIEAEFAVAEADGLEAV
jgi:hypothetical protein